MVQVSQEEKNGTTLTKCWWDSVPSSFFLFLFCDRGVSTYSASVFSLLSTLLVHVLSTFHLVILGALTTIAKQACAVSACVLSSALFPYGEEGKHFAE